MASNRLSIQPVWGVKDRKLSNGVLDTAENLMENIDELAEVLDNLKDKYDKEKHMLADKIPEDSTVTNQTNIRETHELNMFRKLKTCLDSTRFLIGSLRREKDRLMKRELSVECKLGEVEDYKTHVKQDLTSLNELVDTLTTKVCNQEVQICEEQEKYESLKYERDNLKERLKRAENLCKDLNSDNDKLREENKNLAKERTDVLLRLENKEMRYENEVLVVENAKLKEMLRDRLDSSDGDLGVSKLNKTDSKTPLTYLPDLIEDRSNNNDTILINEETVCVRL
ncbi:uncharacterized protein LOC132732736 [Ruditapes philippinarum]|uniref:uncharacterized protein LOC132732736 n=1 Tax=Ruditapes philippinarum TaxID=129788 RepID=UPI00295B3FB6|nr:uncharacterized protein LOC132732736 [Ruditapes philippinarum]XP_060575207.1 uncharacterized protein LOC132732736 [Ruditapes philippinarum]